MYWYGGIQEGCRISVHLLALVMASRREDIFKKDVRRVGSFLDLTSRFRNIPIFNRHLTSTLVGCPGPGFLKSICILVILV